jgi:hypothetical protein
LVVVLGVFAALLVPACLHESSTEWRARRSSSLKEVGFSLQSFNDTYKRLPAATRRDDVGRPTGSWRYQVYPFVEAIMLGIDYSKPWFDPAVRHLSRATPECFCFDRNESSLDRHDTNVAVVCGPGTPFDESRTCSLQDLDDDTILAVEVDLDVHWMAPGDLHIDQLPKSLMNGLDGLGVLVLFADGSVQYVQKGVGLQNLQKLMTVEGAKQHDRQTLLRHK